METDWAGWISLHQLEEGSATTNADVTLHLSTLRDPVCHSDSWPGWSEAPLDADGSIVDVYFLQGGEFVRSALVVDGAFVLRCRDGRGWVEGGYGCAGELGTENMRRRGYWGLLGSYRHL